MHLTVENIRELVDFTEWADATVWKAILANEAARADGTLRDLLFHLHTVQRVFLRIWRGDSLEGMAGAKPTDFPDLAAMQTWARPICDEWRRFLSGVDSPALARTVRLPWADALGQQLGRPIVAPTLSETMFQVVSHSTYHRGQVNTRLRTLGGEPPLVDYIAWVWFDRPMADWGATAVSPAI